MQHKRIYKKILLFFGIFIISSCILNSKNNIAYVQSKANNDANKSYFNVDNNVFSPIYSKHAMVISESKKASEIGVKILQQGGNAIDAAIAVGFALAVLLPNAGNIGGGGFMLYYDAKDNKVSAIDFREAAGQFATKNMFLDDNLNIIENKSIASHYAVGIPGTVAGFEYVWKKWGSMPWDQLIFPAVKIANEGYKISFTLSNQLQAEASKMGKWSATRKIFWKNGAPLKTGDVLIQKDLANSLISISNNGAASFYQGQIAKKIVQEMSDYKGAINLQDLMNYKVIERNPVQGTYRGYTIFSMPPPSSGGIHILQILNILENYPIELWGQNSAKTIHYMVEAMKYAYVDRSFYLGDTDFVNVPIMDLISKNYAKSIVRKITNRITPSINISYGNVDIKDSKHNQTTHFSIIDKEGNAVAVTYTLNTNFGTGIVATGTGILLNDEMDDFSIKPSVANVYGLIGSENNSIVAGKRPLSSMSPTIIFKNNKLFLITGSPGGSRIITIVLETILNAIDFHLNPAENLNSLRFHHQWLPDELMLEKGFNKDTIDLLMKKGYKVTIVGGYGRAQIIKINPNTNNIEGYSDLRNPDGAAVGY